MDDGEEFGGLLESYRHRAQRWAYRVLRNAHDAEEVVGQAYLKALQTADTLREPAAFSTWLYRIVFRMSLNALRDRTAEAKALRSLPTAEADPGVAEAVDDPGRLKAALERLPLDLRIVLTLHYWQGLSYAEIGARLGVPENTIKVRAFRAHQKLKGLLAPS